MSQEILEGEGRNDDEGEDGEDEGEGGEGEDVVDEDATHAVVVVRPYESNGAVAFMESFDEERTILSAPNEGSSASELQVVASEY